MKNLLLFTVFCLMAVALNACQADEPAAPAEATDGEVYVFQERDPSLPLILAKPRTRVSSRGLEPLGFEDCFGRSYRADYYPFENMENVSYPVLDIKRLIEDNPSWFTLKKLNNTLATSSAYSSFDYYEENTNMTKKVSGGAGLNLGLFRIGAKRSLTETFSSAKVNQSNAVFGQLDICVRNRSYEMQMNSNILNRIRWDGYFEKDFLSDLYNLPMSEFMDHYGPFVLSGFVTGGKATASYVGQYKYASSAYDKERDMHTEISGSYGTNSSNMGIGKRYSNSSVSTNSFNGLETSVWTVGGSGQGTFTIPASIDDVNVNLTPWYNSLSDEDTHTIIDINNNGLIPIMDFPLEYNFRWMTKKYYEDGTIQWDQFVEPKIKIGYFTQDLSIGIYHVAILDRYGHYIMLNWVAHNTPTVSIIQQVNSLAEEYSRFYKMRIEVSRGTAIELMALPLRGVEDGLLIFEKNMVKVFDEKNQIIYLLTSGISEKIGYSIYVGEGDFLLDTYGIREWVDTMPEGNININQLSSYTIIAF